MSKLLVLLALCFSAPLSGAADGVAAPAVAAMTRTSSVQSPSPSGVHSTPSKRNEAAVGSEREADWEMVLAAVVLMGAVALRRYRSGRG